jgi:hypothetical protein
MQGKFKISAFDLIVPEGISRIHHRLTVYLIPMCSLAPCNALAMYQLRILKSSEGFAFSYKEQILKINFHYLKRRFANCFRHAF